MKRGHNLMASATIEDTMSEANHDLAAIVRAGCFTSEEEAMREAVQTLLAVNPQLRLEAAIRRYLDGESTLGRAAEIAGVTRWRLQELLALRGLRVTLEACPAKELDKAVERILKKMTSPRLNSS
jgi:predicted HTH domain antitoxin